MFLGASSSFAVIYKVDEWVKESAGDTVVCFSDMHCDKGNQKITDKQRADIIAKAKKQKAFVIVEDYDVVDDGSGLLQEKHKTMRACSTAAERYYKKNLADFIVDVSPLRGLMQACNAERILCSNVEFRQYVYNAKDME
jgi:hypothetical protein